MSKKGLTFVFLSKRTAGGMERRYFNLCLYLMDKGFNVDILCTKEFYAGIKERGVYIPDDRIEFVDYEGSQLRAFNITRRLVSVLVLLKKSRGKEKLFIVSNPGILIYVISFFSKLMPPFSFVMVHSILINYNKKYFKRLIKQAYRIDCLSEDILNYAINELDAGEDKAKLALAPCSFIDYSKIIHNSKKEIDIVFLGRFVEDKGLDLLESIDSEMKDINLHVYGFGKRYPQLKNAHISKVDNGFLVLSQAKIFLSIQKYENYPSQSLLEAMASGCAIIATDVGLTRKLLDESCCIFIKYDADELLTAIKYLLNTIGLVEKLGANAAIKANKEHTIERYAEYFQKEFM